MDQFTFEEVSVGNVINGPSVNVTEEMIQEFARASLDYNALHLDDQFMEKDFGKTSFKGVIAHGMMTFSIMTRMMTDWLWPQGKIHRRIETRWLNPVYPGDNITATATIIQKNETLKGKWLLFNLEVKNQDGELVASGQSMAECPE
jgi:acyl dehydratase